MRIRTSGATMTHRYALNVARAVVGDHPGGWAATDATLTRDNVARMFAGDWASPGAVGRALAALATGADAELSDVLADVEASIPDARGDADAMLSLHYLHAWATIYAPSPVDVRERMIADGVLAPAARDLDYADTLDAWADTNALDGVDAAREAATYGAAAVVICRERYPDVGTLDGDAAEITRVALWLDGEDENDRHAAAARLVREHGCTFDATGADWAADPDGQRVDPHTGRVEITSAHLYGVDVAAVQNIA